MDKTMTITSAQATTVLKAIMAKASKDDTIEIDYGYRSYGDTKTKTYFYTSVNAFGKGNSYKSYIHFDITFFDTFITVQVSRSGIKYGYYKYNICG